MQRERHSARKLDAVKVRYRLLQVMLLAGISAAQPGVGQRKGRIEYKLDSSGIRQLKVRQLKVAQPLKWARWAAHEVDSVLLG